MNALRFATGIAPVLGRYGLELLHANGTLLEVRLSRNRIEGSQGYQVGVGFRKMKGHEDLPGGDNPRNTQLHILYRTAPGNDGYTIVRFELQFDRIVGVHLQPGSGHHAFQHFHLGSLGASVPVLHRAASVEDEVVVLVWLFNERQTRYRVKDGFARCRRKRRIGVQVLAAPLHAAVVFNLLPGKWTVVAHASCGDTLPLPKGIMSRFPAGIELILDPKLFGESKKDVKIRARLTGRRNQHICLADSALGVGVGAFLLPPDGRRQNQVREVAGGRGIKTILHHHKIHAAQPLLQQSIVRKGDSWIRGDEPKGSNLARDRAFDNVGIRQPARGGNAIHIDIPQLC